MTIDEVNSKLSRAGRNKPAAKQVSNLPTLLASICERVTAMKAQIVNADAAASAT